MTPPAEQTPRERLARIIDPNAFDQPGHTAGLFQTNEYLAGLQREAFQKADAILASGLLSPTGTAGWQDIASAPRDGTYILVYPAMLGYPMVATWDPDCEKYTRWQHNWRAAMSGKPVPYDPTHWQPLPPPPLSTTAAEQPSEGEK